MYYLFLILAVITALIFTIRRGTKTDAVSLLLKAIASFCFILLGIAGIFEGSSHAFALADRKSTRLNSSYRCTSRMPSSA